MENGASPLLINCLSEFQRCKFRKNSYTKNAHFLTAIEKKWSKAPNLHRPGIEA